MALAILSGMPVNEFVQCVAESNSAALVKVPGVGKKTAERLIIEIKDRIKGWQTPDSTVATFGDTIVGSPQQSITEDAESALIALGYKPTDAAKVIANVQKVEVVASSEELIRLALQSLAG